MSDQRFHVFHCPQCKGRRTFERAPIRHGIHAALTVLTLGLWGVSWLALSIGSGRKPWACRDCGFRIAGTVAEAARQASADSKDHVD